MKRLDRWLAHVRKQLPGPMYDHPQKAREPWDEAAAARALYAWARDAVERDFQSTNYLYAQLKEIGQ